MRYTPKKELGQNFLTDMDAVARLVELLEPSDDDKVIEIGAGLGALTQQLADFLVGSTSKIYAIEIDSRFTTKLENMFRDYSTVRVVHADVLEWLPNFDVLDEFKILGSLPYYITSPILHAIVKMKKRPDMCVLVVQKEVADKICATVPDASYLSTFIQTFFDVSCEGVISREKFDPAPQVDGGILKLVKKEAAISWENIEKYEGFLHKGFSNPRKMLNKVFSPEELTRVDVSGDLRPQNLEPSKWIQMFNTLV